MPRVGLGRMRAGAVFLRLLHKLKVVVFNSAGGIQTALLGGHVDAAITALYIAPRLSEDWKAELDKNQWSDHYPNSRETRAFWDAQSETLRRCCRPRTRQIAARPRPLRSRAAPARPAARGG